jgi:hypothetical protein
MAGRIVKKICAALGADVASVGLLAVLLGGAGLGWAQDIQLGRPPAPRAGAAAPGTPAAPPPAATTPDPDRVRTLLRALHGFSRAALDTASADVAAILMRFIDDPAEAVLVKRQAIKALGLYPTDSVLAFIEARAPAAPNPYKPLFVGSLGAFAASQPVRVTAAVTPLLADPDVGVRAAAAHLANTLPPSPTLKAALQDRIAVEPSADLRAKLRSALSRQ